MDVYGVVVLDDNLPNVEGSSQNSMSSGVVVVWISYSSNLDLLNSESISSS